MNKDFSVSKELPRVNFVKCAMYTKYGNNTKIEPQHERLPGNFPRGSLRSEILTPSRLIIVYLKILFSN